MGDMRRPAAIAELIMDSAAHTVGLRPFDPGRLRRLPPDGLQFRPDRALRAY